MALIFHTAMRSCRCEDRLPDLLDRSPSQVGYHAVILSGLRFVEAGQFDCREVRHISTRTARTFRGFLRSGSHVESQGRQIAHARRGRRRGRKPEMLGPGRMREVGVPSCLPPELRDIRVPWTPALPPQRGNEPMAYSSGAAFSGSRLDLIEVPRSARVGHAGAAQRVPLSTVNECAAQVNELRSACSLLLAIGGLNAVG
jgi:hypothetical protein